MPHKQKTALKMNWNICYTGLLKKKLSGMSTNKIVTNKEETL